MRKNFSKKFNILILLFFFLILTPFFVKAESSCQEGAKRCSSRYGGIIEKCGNCDSDTDLEWCYSEDCGDQKGICVSGSCGNISCNDEQLVGDVNNDGYINVLDQELINLVVYGTLASPADTCCLDVDNNGKVEKADGEMADNIFKSLTKFPGTCREVKEKNKNNLCNNDGQCGERENNENCPNDCPGAGSILNKVSNKKTIVVIAAVILFLIMIAVAVYYFLRKRKNRDAASSENKNNGSSGNSDFHDNQF